ncbi:MAG: amidohydrolase family protein [Chloroflexota bacterium]|nr:amidohydrolase family protein [Chloroflexota bacterium]
MVIDFHTHIFHPSIKQNRDEFLKKDRCLELLYSTQRAKIATAEELVQSMDDDGIDVSVVLNGGWYTQELCIETNDYILESIARYPKRIIGFCAIQPNAGDKALREIERCAECGARGIGELRPDDQGINLGDKKTMDPIVELLVKHNLLFLTHASEPVGHLYQGKGVVTPATIYPFLCNYPQLRVICAHWGGGLPFYALMPEVRAVLANTYFDSAASPFLYEPEIYERVSELIGPEKILFGTDYPLLKQGRVRAQIDTSRLSKSAKSMILGGNAKKLLYGESV